MIVDVFLLGLGVSGLLVIVVCILAAVDAVREAMASPPKSGAVEPDPEPDPDPVCPRCSCCMAEVCEQGLWHRPDARTMRAVFGSCPCMAAAAAAE